MPELEDGTPYVAIGNDEPLPDWLLEKPEFAELLQTIRASRRARGRCDHGRALFPLLPGQHPSMLCAHRCA